MAEHPVHHSWAPITDLGDDDFARAGDELPALMAVWDEARGELDERQVEEFNDRLNREWAIETGIIERIYTLDEGTTRLLIEQGIDASLIAHDNGNGGSPELIAGIIRDHQEAVEWLFEIVRQERPLTTSFIKELHHLMTRKQTHADGVDMFGRATRIELRHGEYKQRPNNPTRSDGATHEYCPPEHVAAEMDRLIEFHNEHIVLEVPPDLEAAWLHHRFIQIHPFQDGNGRVARAIASLVLLRAGWFPLVVRAKERRNYIDTLEAADTGDIGPLTELVGTMQKRACRAALSILGEVEREEARLEQMIEAIGEAFDSRDRDLTVETAQAREIADHLQEIAIAKFEEVCVGLVSRIGREAADRDFFVIGGRDDDPGRRTWFRHQVVDTAQRLDYFANVRDYHAWARLTFHTESGLSDILLSFHTVGRDFRGVVGASMCFYRRQASGDEEAARQVVELQTVSDDLFQINYKEDLDEAERRFAPWLERALVKGLDQWRRGE